MRRAVKVGLVTIAALCWVGLLRHRVRRAGPMGGYRCETCGRAFADLDDSGEQGSGYVRPGRAIFTREGAGGRQEFSRDGTGNVA